MITSPKPSRLFFLGAAYLDSPLEELITRPEFARKGNQLLQDYLGKVSSTDANHQYLSRAEALLGKGYQTLNQPDVAIKHYEGSLRAEGRQLLPAYNLGVLYAGRRDFSRSEQSFATASQHFPKHVPSIHGLGALAEAKGNLNEALKYFEEAIRLYPPSLSSHYRLAQMHLRSQSDDKAEAELQTCLSLDPRYLPALVDLQKPRTRQRGVSSTSPPVSSTAWTARSSSLPTASTFSRPPTSRSRPKSANASPAAASTTSSDVGPSGRTGRRC